MIELILKIYRIILSLNYFYLQYYIYIYLILYLCIKFYHIPYIMQIIITYYLRICIHVLNSYLIPHPILRIIILISLKIHLFSYFYSNIIYNNNIYSIYSLYHLLSLYNIHYMPFQAHQLDGNNLINQNPLISINYVLNQQKNQFVYQCLKKKRNFELFFEVFKAPFLIQSLVSLYRLKLFLFCCDY